MTNIEIEEFHIAGIVVRTRNQGGQSQKDIGELFGRFMGENIIENIPNKSNSDVYCMYTEYENDHNGFYTTIIGCKVNSLENIPKGLVGMTIPTTKYEVYQSIGPLPDSVGKTWGKIWELDIDRKYIADFDVYGLKSQNTDCPEVNTYVSIN